MKAAIVVFPGSNCDRDVAVALEAVTGRPPAMVWHRETELPPADLVVLPGGFSYGDYLRCGAIAARSPVIDAVRGAADRGVPILGICNGFQMLTELGYLPGALMRNAALTFLSAPLTVRVERAVSPYTQAYEEGQVLSLPVAHMDGNYVTDPQTAAALQDEGRVLLRYCDADGGLDEASNPNGSVASIAGITDRTGRILGLMPHAERAIEPAQRGTDGRGLFTSLAEALG